MRITKDRYIESNTTPIWILPLNSDSEFDLENLCN